MNTIVPVTENKIFLRDYKKGKTFVCPQLIVYVMKNKYRYKRLGITVGKKCGIAVARSRCRRVVRVMYRENYDMIPAGYDIIIVARKPLADMNASDASELFARQTKSFFASFSSKNIEKKKTEKLAEEKKIPKPENTNDNVKKTESAH